MSFKQGLGWSVWVTLLPGAGGGQARGQIVRIWALRPPLTDRSAQKLLCLGFHPQNGVKQRSFRASVSLSLFTEKPYFPTI